MQDISPPSPAPISAASPSAVQDLIKKIQELYSLVTVPAQKWEENLPHMHELVTWIQHSLALTDSENAPLNEIQTLQTEIADIQNTIAKFTEPAIREKASSILQHITTMSGQLFIGPEHNGKTAYMKASYKPLNLVALLNEIRPFLLEILKYSDQPHVELQQTISQQNMKIEKQDTKIGQQDTKIEELNMHIGQQDTKIEELNMHIGQQDTKIEELNMHIGQQDTKIEELNMHNEQQDTKIEEQSHHIKSIHHTLQIMEERAAKTETMNAIYNFVHSVERIICRHLEFDGHWSMTLSQALRNNATEWSDVRDVLKLNNQSKGCLLNTINKIKSERLEYGHASLLTSKNLVLSTNLIPLAQEHFSLIRTEVNMLQTLLAWVLPLLPPSATLEDLKQEAWTFSL
ncbi:hypothetical protein MJO28_016118 [Puccinia striiformis f. sp. tritici]|uniref:Uncharacterized protein n=1 Tax=Puccinia striiformis f. sp. tritici TaxID=168172 RepID=A0ACC0DTJ0_9BASI|nr:hypothetical protein MJO28_016118 [Puccinia striiformis f. sp. tritici]